LVSLPLALHPFREIAGRLGRGLDGRGRRRRSWLELLEVQGLVAVLGRVEVVGASGVTREGHVGEARVWVLLEELEEKDSKSGHC